MKRGAEFVDKLSGVAHIHIHRRAGVHRGLAIVDAPIRVRIVDKTRVVHHRRPGLVAHGHVGVQRHISDIGDLEVVLGHRAAGQQQFRVSGYIQRGHCGDLGIDGIRINRFDDAQRFVKIDRLRDVADKGSRRDLLGSGTLWQEADHQRDGPETRHHAQSGFVNSVAHLI